MLRSRKRLESKRVPATMLTPSDSQKSSRVCPGVVGQVGSCHELVIGEQWNMKELADTIAIRSSVSLTALFLLTLSSSFTFAQGSQTFRSTGNLHTGRNTHRAIMLNVGTVLIAGGYDVNENALASSELYNPTTGTFTTTGSLNVARRNCSITLLDDGTVLLAGGYDASFNTLASAEIYHPGSGTFTLTGNLSTARADLTATRLNDGTVLIAGGFDNSGRPLSSAELYIPATGTFVATGSLTTARGFSTATSLMSGTILIAGGWGTGGALSSAELYDPATKLFSSTGSLNGARVRHTATLLNGGNVLIVGGEDSANNILSSAELYNPTQGSFTLTGSLNTARGDSAATLLTNGTVLVEGGFACQPSNCSTSVVDMSASAEIYDPASGAFSLTGSLATARQVHTATLLLDGTVLVAGGWSGSNSGLTSAELYQPGTLAPVNLVSISVGPVSPTLIVGKSLALAATGTFSDKSTQKLASAIWSSSDNTVATVTNDSGSNSGMTNDSTNSGVVFGLAVGSSTVSACTGAICGSTTGTVLSPGTVQGFALLGSPGNVTVAAGGTAKFQLTLSPQGGFMQSVALSCTGVPPGATCTITPASLTLGGTNNAAATATIATAISSVAWSRSRTRPAAHFWAPRGAGGASILSPWTVALLPLALGFCVLARRSKKTTSATLMTILLISQLSACGESGSGGRNSTPSGTYTIVVTATAGRLSRSVQFSLTVK